MTGKEEKYLKFLEERRVNSSSTETETAYTICIAFFKKLFGHNEKDNTDS